MSRQQKNQGKVTKYKCSTCRGSLKYVHTECQSMLPDQNNCTICRQAFDGGQPVGTSSDDNFNLNDLAPDMVNDVINGFGLSNMFGSQPDSVEIPNRNRNRNLAAPVISNPITNIITRAYNDYQNEYDEEYDENDENEENELDSYWSTNRNRNRSNSRTRNSRNSRNSNESNSDTINIAGFEVDKTYAFMGGAAVAAGLAVLLMNNESDDEESDDE
jgi:hypothetical protein